MPNLDCAEPRISVLEHVKRHGEDVKVVPAFRPLPLQTRPVHTGVETFFELEPLRVHVGNAYVFGRFSVEPVLKGVAFGEVRQE